jgi:hypothetical protein
VRISENQRFMEPRHDIRHGSKSSNTGFVIPACFWRESSPAQPLDSRQKHAGMTVGGADCYRKQGVSEPCLIFHYTRHALRRMRWRKVTKEQVEKAVQSPDNLEPSLKNRMNAYKAIQNRLLQVT